jgi:hypothetical protein
MQLRALAFALGAAATVAACGPNDQSVTGIETAAPRQALAAPAPVCVHFNVPALGAVYGAPVGNPPGTVVFVENTIPVSVDRFLLSTGVWTYNWMRIENAPAVFTLAAGKTDHTNNTTTGFDFTGVGFPVKKVVFNWLNLGGYENLSVNGSPMFVGQLSAPPAFIGGVGVATAWGFVAGGKQGTTTLTGAITKILVGGQEEWLDNVCAYP